MLFTDLQFTKSQEVLKEIYAIYADYVFKNPFYTLDMPVANSCQKFVLNVQELIDKINEKENWVNTVGNYI